MSKKTTKKTIIKKKSDKITVEFIQPVIMGKTYFAKGQTTEIEKNQYEALKKFIK